MAVRARQAWRLLVGKDSAAAGKRRSEEFSRIHSGILGFRRNQEQNLGFSSLGSCFNGDLFLRLARNQGYFLGLATMSPLRFYNGKASGRAGGASSILGFSALALWLSTELSHAEDQDTDLRPQPQAKSNIHTAKWRIFTDKARDLFGQGSFDSAEKFFYKALEEAKLGFGEEDPHVASAYNNLAELFRMKKEYDKAEPFYLEAVNRLRQTSDVEDGSVGFALHNLGGFYLLQRKITQAHACYEEALKIKGRALGLDHPEYANTMFHLGEVIRLQGDVDDGLALIRDSIRILEQVGLGNTQLAVKRLTRLSELLVFSNQLSEAEAVQWKVLQVLEFSKNFLPNDMAAALENLSATLEKQGKIDESGVLLEKSISLRRNANADDDLHVAASLLKLGEIFFQQGKSAMSKQGILQAVPSYDKAEGLLLEAVKIVELLSEEDSARQRRGSAYGNTVAASILLAHCLTTLGDLQIHKLEIIADKEVSLNMCAQTEMVLLRAMFYLDNIISQKGDKTSSEVRKLYQECARNLDEVKKRKLNLQCEGNA